MSVVITIDENEDGNLTIDLQMSDFVSVDVPPTKAQEAGLFLLECLQRRGEVVSSNVEVNDVI